VEQRGRLYPGHDFRLDVYFPIYQLRSRTSSVLLCLRRDSDQSRFQLSQLLAPIAPDVPVFDVKTLAERRHDEEAGPRLNTLLLTFFAASALALAVVGIYSILVYSVRQQSFELGLRMALGADRSRILRRVARQGATLLGGGLLAGLVFALGLARTMS